MITVADLIAPERQNDPDAIEARIVSAYMAFVSGNASKSDADVILIDLAQTSGYYETLPEDATPGMLAAHNGARKVFGRIMFATNLPQDRLNELATALLSTPVPTTE